MAPRRAPAWAVRLAGLLPSPRGDTGWVRAPGRVNLIGEHTDYNDGLVLPVAINLEIRGVFARRSDGLVTATSTTLQARDAFQLGEEGTPHKGRWSDYLRGVCVELRDEGFDLSRGLDIVLDATLPAGAGLGSSAALEAIFALAILVANGFEAIPFSIAHVCRRAENRYVGVNCGLMDQVASLLAKRGHAALLDCRNLDLTYVPLPPNLAIAVCDTKVARRLDASEYNLRRSQCEEGVSLMAQSMPGLVSLRDVNLQQLDALVSRMPEVVAKRCRHVIAENGRVVAAVAALRQRRLLDLTRIFAESHQSLKELYEVSSPELDAMVAAALQAPGCLAARLTGAGFGGCTVNLVHKGQEVAFRRSVAAVYRQATGIAPSIHLCRSVDGASTGLMA